ncbi:hypothetical protein HDU81_003287 [Chytriomyces hyalinus]|nr:hypothetical protein HDU81_003287 [Chytriomyces hyalinus]
MSQVPQHVSVTISPECEDGNDHQFFDFLGLRHPRAGGSPHDLSKFFAENAYLKAATNPYAMRCESLMDYKDLPATQFTSKIPSMCKTIPWFGTFMILFDLHYELGRSLVMERPPGFRAKGKGRLRMYDSYSVYRVMLHDLLLCLLLVISIAYLVAFYTGNDPVKPANTAVIPPYTATLACLICIAVLSKFAQQNEHKRGILRYLRQVGTPLVEEVMISYSWQKGVYQDTRCIAKALIQSGIGVWIDVLKLTSGDSTSRTTRTVAAHARFVLVVLTSRYVLSPNCFIELHEALRAPTDPRLRLIIYRPDETAYGEPVDEQASAKVDALAAQLESKGIRVLKTMPMLVDFLNRHIIYSVDQSHFTWWLKYVGSSTGVPEEFIAPDEKSTSALKKFNFKLLCLPSFKGHGVRNKWRNEVPIRFRKGAFKIIRRIRISNVWISGDLREMGQNASSFPWKLLALVVFLSMPLIDLFSDGARLISSPTNTIPFSFIGVSLCLALVAGMLNLGGFTDQRLYLHPSLKPLLATNNFNLSKKAPKKWVGQARPRWTRAEELERTSSEESLELQPNSQSSIFLRYSAESIPGKEFRAGKGATVSPDSNLDSKADKGKLYIAIHDFGTNHPVAKTLRQFLNRIGFRHPRHRQDIVDGSSIVVHVFIFGGGLSKSQARDSQREIVVAQVGQFNEYLEKNGLAVEDCVLAASHAEDADVDVPGLFEATISSSNLVLTAMGAYLILLSHALGKTFGEEVILQTGLRVKNALMRFGKRNARTLPDANK